MSNKTNANKRNNVVEIEGGVKTETFSPETTTTTTTTAPEPIAPEGMAQGLVEAVEAAQSVATLDHTKARPNRLFASQAAAFAAINEFAARDAFNLQWLRQAACELVEDYAMNKDPLRNTANPLTHLVLKLAHRANKGGIASKLKTWVSMCTNYKWHDKSGAFALKKGMRANVSFNDAQREVFNTAFDLYSKPSKDTWELEKAIKAAIKKADARGMNTAAIAEALKPYVAGNVPKTVNVADTITIPTTQGSKQAATPEDHDKAA